jgi:hypothetical protein
MIQDDTTLVERVLSGDKSAFGPLIDQYWPKAMSLALRRLGNFADAEDTVQNAFLRALLDLPSLRNADRFDSWLLGIVGICAGCTGVRSATIMLSLAPLLMRLLLRIRMGS